MLACCMLRVLCAEGMLKFTSSCPGNTIICCPSGAYYRVGCLPFYFRPSRTHARLHTLTPARLRAHTLTQAYKHQLGYETHACPALGRAPHAHQGSGRFPCAVPCHNQLSEAARRCDGTMSQRSIALHTLSATLGVRRSSSRSLDGGWRPPDAPCAGEGCESAAGDGSAARLAGGR